MRITGVQIAGAMIAAALPLTLLPAIPASSTIALLALGAVIVMPLPVPGIRLAAAVVLLLCWALLAARQTLDQLERLTQAPVSATVRVTAVNSTSQQLTVQLLRIGERYLFPPTEVTLANPPQDQHYCPGQRWQMTLRLRAVHARLNEGAFDQQRFALASHRPLQGRILQQQAVSPRCNLRARLIERYRTALAPLPQSGILQALAFGIRDEMTPAQRTLLRETGTAHLMAISGMHIALAASAGGLLARAVQILLPAHRIGFLLPLAISWLSAALYCWISGSHAPAQRAMLALTLWMAIKTAGWQLSHWQIWTLCVGGLLWLDPLSVLSESFWLSALAVAMLIIWSQWFALPLRYRQQKRWIWLTLLHLQLGMMILMAPLQVYLFHGISLSALPANLLAIPVISLITVPLILLAMVMPVPAIAETLWSLAGLSVSAVMQLLQWLPAGWWPLHAALPLMAGVWGGLLLWRSGLIYRAWLPCCSLVIALLLWRSSSEQDDWQIDVIDVGHGLALAITQGREVVLYDSGPAWQQDDAGARVVLPWLRYHGKTLQTVILSHRHLDHRGGLASLQQANPAITVRSALGEAGHLPCQRGTQWQWGRLRFTALWPPAGQQQGQNNDSCVVRVDDGHISLLLTGDIELEAERRLVALEKQALHSTFLQVPHHGSRTSSGALLLRNVAGSAAFASVARYNAWRLPAQAVIARYRQQGYAWYDTAQSGQIHIGIRQGRWKIKGLREQIMPRWYHQWFGVKRDSR